MNAQPTNHNDPIDRDLLISRVVDDMASASDWLQLRAMAEIDASVWRELFEAQHAHSEFTQAVRQAIQFADGVDAPVGELSSPPLVYRFRQASRWAGWAVAAGVALAWVAPAYLIGTTTENTTPIRNDSIVLADEGTANAGRSRATTGADFDVVTESGPLVGPYASRPAASLAGRPTEAGSPLGFDALRQVSAESGTQTVGEMPDRVLIEMRRLPDGRMELVYVRRVIEKAIVGENDLYQVVPDDTGTDRAVPLRQRRPSSGPI